MNTDIISWLIPNIAMNIDDLIDTHGQLMPYIWTISINVAILCAQFKFSLISMTLHVLIALFVSLVTLTVAYPLFLQWGFPQVEDQYYSQRHTIIGFIVIFLVFVQVIFGIISRIITLIKFSHPYLIHVLIHFHKINGYILLIVGKIQAYLKLKDDDEKNTLFWGLIIGQLLFALIFVVLKLFPVTYQKSIAPKTQAIDLIKVKSIHELKDRYENVGVFANYVYDITPLENLHPYGYKIIESIKNREFDRFIYGMYSTERFSWIKPHSHSFKAFNLLKNPVAKVEIQSLYEGMQENHNQFVIHSINEVSSSTRIYEILLRKKEGSLSYKGYRSLSQIGRYFSFTINEKTTRLYTTVGFLQNTTPSHKSSINYDNNTSKKTITQSLLTQEDKHSQEGLLHLLIKVYPKGKLTPELLKEPDSIKISEQRGEGLSLQSVTPGKIVIVAGGTGLFPFSDLIDLLYKSELLKKKDPSSSHALKESPVLESKPFARFNFHLFLAVQYIEDIHPLTLRQLSYLSQNPQFFRLTLRIRNANGESGLNKPNVQVTERTFDLLIGNLLQSEKVSKIFVCGPPPMQEAMMKMFDQRNTDRSEYSFV